MFTLVINKDAPNGGAELSNVLVTEVQVTDVEYFYHDKTPYTVPKTPTRLL